MPDYGIANAAHVAEAVTPSERVLETVAAYSNTPPEELPLLYEAIDPDALDALFTSNELSARVEFEYNDYHVAVSDDGVVDLTRLTE